jgi:hypothetical protein
MIYDYQDMSTKYYIAARVRDWVQEENNVLVLLRNPKVKELTESDLSWNSDDDIVWTVLYLIGVRLLRYVVSNDGAIFNLGLNLNWRKPAWLLDVESRKKLNNHIDFMMEIEREGYEAGTEPTALIASLEISKYGRLCMLPPKEPAKNDMAHELLILARNQKRLAAKRSFHRRGGR